MTELLLISVLVTEILKYGIWFTGISRTKMRHISKAGRSYAAAGCFIGIYLVLIVTGVIREDVLLTFWGISALILYGFILEKNQNEKMLYMLQTYLIVMCMDQVAFCTVELLTMGEKYDMPGEVTMYLTGNTAVILFLLVISFVKKKLGKINEWKNKKIVQILICIVAAVMVVVVLLTVVGFYEVSQRTGNNNLIVFSGIITIISYVCIIFLILLMSYIYNENRRSKMLLEKEAQLVEMQKNMYEAMLSKNEETKRFRHDVQNHLMCLGELADHGEIEKVSSYISSMEGTIRTIQERTYHVGNSVMDAVLNYYVSMLRESVSVHIDGICAPNVAMSEMEFCTVVSNLIQNAVEALNQADGEGYLKVKFEQKKNAVRVGIKNSISGGHVILDEKSKLPVTTKENKESHGMGLRNAREVVEKNGGMFEAAVKENIFSVIMEIPLQH